jgi:XTP/dITP diphosphohydrolase
MEIVIATKNKGKIEEITGFEKSCSKIQWLTFKDFESFPLVEEIGNSFLDNAIIKAEAISKFTGKAALADDSGLIVDALGGGPGVRSSRYAGPDASDKENRDKLLDEIKHVKEPGKRSARFVCSMVLWDADNGLVFKTEGVCEGKIGFEEKGSGGFGYDCIFIPEGYKRTMAELESNEKNTISHRGRALSDFCGFIVKK